MLVGVVVGAAALAALGAPARRLDPASLIDALARSGLDVDALEPLPSATPCSWAAGRLGRPSM